MANDDATTTQPTIKSATERRAIHRHGDLIQTDAVLLVGAELQSLGAVTAVRSRRVDALAGRTADVRRTHTLADVYRHTDTRAVD